MRLISPELLMPVPFGVDLCVGFQSVRERIETIREFGDATGKLSKTQ